MSDVKQRMIGQAVILMARKGPMGASLSEVLEASGAPRGSLYHHFPGGKDELVLAAMNEADRRALAFLQPMAGRSADEVAAAFVGLWRAVLTQSRLEAGCAVLAVTLGSDSPEYRLRAGQIFHAWREMLSAMLQEGGVPLARAEGLAAMLISVCEGAVAVARAENSMLPFDLAVAELLGAVKSAMAR